MTIPWRALGAALLFLACPAPALTRGQEVPATAQGRLISVVRHEGEDGPRWNVLCDRAGVEDVLRILCKKAGLALEGTELLTSGATVSLELQRRPLDQVLEYLLGSVGLRHELARGTLALRPPAGDPAELARLAESAWQDVQTTSDGGAATQARLALANLAEVRGDLEGAFLAYQALAEEGPGEEAAEASYRAGRLLERLGHWAEAAQLFRTLGAMEEGKRFHSRARLELARVSIELGDPQSALHLLNFLDSNYPVRDRVELAERRLVRARAHNACGEHVEALRTLEQGEVASADDSGARALEVRAIAFEGLGFEVEAARAWLLFAREASALERVPAFERAVRLALEAGDELGALFLCREAAKSGADEGLGLLAREARARLGLDEAAPASILERLELAERRLAEGDPHEAAELFEGLYLARGALPESDRTRVLAGWARCVLERSGLDAALELLASARAGLEDPEAQRSIDLAAAALLEDQGDFERAAEAYRGVY